MPTYGSSVRVIRLGKVVALAANPDAISSSSIEIVGTTNTLNKALKDVLGGTAMRVAIVAEVSGDADTVILTDGLRKSDPAARHWRVLQQACRAQARAHRVICLQSETPTNLMMQGGLMGLSRTLRKEWPAVNTACWSLPALTAAPMAELVSLALQAELGDAVLHADGGYQTQLIGEPVSLPRAAQDDPGLWLVTGGARGVTSDCAIELARRTGGTFILAGRSTLRPWPQAIAPTTDLKSLRGRLARHAKATGKAITPIELNRLAQHSLAGQEIRQTLQAVSEVGGRAEYLQLDLGNRDGVASALAELADKHGPITGLVHGAGVLSDRLALQKTGADIAAVFGPKVDGLLNLSVALDFASLKHIGLFSSASAVFGNTGQADYAMANQYLNQAARSLAVKLPETQIKSFNWGPWDGGMVDASLAEHFAAQGISLIGRPDGARIFADQLLHGNRDEVELLIGDQWDAV